MENLRKNELTKNVGLRWSKDEDIQLIEELTIKNIDLETIARIHGRTIRGIIERRNLLIHNDFKKNNNMEDLENKYHISELECFVILQKFQEKELKKEKEKINNKSNISDYDKRIPDYDNRIQLLENRVESINNTLIEIRDLLKNTQNKVMIPNNYSNNPFDEL